MRPRWLAPLLLLLWALGLAAWAWDMGPDPWIDFGRELYVPWRLVQGDALHRDVAWFNGPFSPWWNAAWMRLAGVSFDTLQSVNLLVALGAAALLHRLLAAATDRRAAHLALFAFFPIFAFSQQKAIGNYTFLAPYSHDLVHGYVLALAALAALLDVRTTGRAALGGLALGCVALTKAEVLVAAGGASALALGFALVRAPARGRLALAFTLGAVAPVALAWLRLRGDLAPSEATRALLGTWVHALDPDLSSQHFYREMRGSDEPLRHVVTALHVAAWLGLLVLALAGLAHASRRVCARLAPRGPAEGTRPELAALAALGAALVVAVFTRAPLELVARPLPLLLALVGLVALTELRAPDVPHDPARRRRGRARLVLVAFSGLLALKLGLKPTVRDYGFVLAAPGLLLALATLDEAGSRALGPARARGRALLLGAAAALALLHANASHTWFARKRFEAGRGGDRVRVLEWRGDQLQELLDDLDALVPADGTLLVLPEGVTLNYWLRRRAPIAVYNFMPPELLMYGEERLVSELRARPPDVVVLAHKETREYGYRFFGQGYGERLSGWLLEDYREVRRIGHAPLTSRSWGASVFVPRASGR